MRNKAKILSFILVVEMSAQTSHSLDQYLQNDQGMFSFSMEIRLDASRHAAVPAAVPLALQYSTSFSHVSVAECSLIQRDFQTVTLSMILQF